MATNLKINIDDIQPKYSDGNLILLKAGPLNALWTNSLSDGKKVWQIYLGDADSQQSCVRTCFDDDLPGAFFPEDTEDFEMKRVLFKMRFG